MAQYEWPPKDEFATQQNFLAKQKLEKLIREEPFTFGRDLNPELIPGNSMIRKRNNLLGGRKDYYEEINSEEEQERRGGWSREGEDKERVVESDEEDNIPLGIAMRRAKKLNNSQAIPWLEKEDFVEPEIVRVRRGSEGYEIKPLIQPNYEFEEENFDLEREEGEFNSDGDTVRRGDFGKKYRVIRDEEREDWDDSSDSDE